jgi:hypothetical protein
MRSKRQRATGALVSVSAAILIGGTMVSAGVGFHPTVVLREAPDGRALLVQDIAAKGDNVGVVWQEQDQVTIDDDLDPRLRYRLSTNGGQTFQASDLLDNRDSRDASADVCDGFFWVASLLHDPADAAGVWHVVLDGRDFVGGVTAGYLLTDPFEDVTAYPPDVACIGTKRHIVAWVEEAGATDDLHITFPEIFQHFEDPMPEFDFGPFDAHGPLGVSVAATGSRAYAAWVRRVGGEERLRFKRFTIGGLPNANVTAHATISLPDDLDAGGLPQLAAHGDTVVLAYMHQASPYVRISDDGGVTFGPREELIDVPFPSEVAGWPASTDLRGARAVINVTIFGQSAGDPEPNVSQYRISSSDGGDDWTGNDVADSVGTQGDRVGAFSRLAGETRLVEAWDKQWDDAAPQKLRFHRET